MTRVHDPKNRNCEATKGHQCKIKECPTCTCPPTIEHEENTTIDPIIEEKVQAIEQHYFENFAVAITDKNYLRTVLTEVHTSAEQLGYEQGFVKGQKHAFGVDRKAVEQEGYVRAMREVRETLMSMAEITVDGSAKYWKMPWHKDFQDGDKFAPQRFIDMLFPSPTDNNKEIKD